MLADGSTARIVTCKVWILARVELPVQKANSVSKINSILPG